MFTKEQQVGKKRNKKEKTPIPYGEKCCQGCGVYHNLEIHHVYGNSSRNFSSMHKCVEWLCNSCHRGENGVHGDNYELDMYFKQKHQIRLESNGMDREHFRYLFGKSYL